MHRIREHILAPKSLQSRSAGSKSWPAGQIQHEEKALVWCFQFCTSAFYLSDLLRNTCQGAISALEIGVQSLLGQWPMEAVAQHEFLSGVGGKIRGCGVEQKALHLRWEAFY